MSVIVAYALYNPKEKVKMPSGKNMRAMKDGDPG